MEDYVNKILLLLVPPGMISEIYLYSFVGKEIVSGFVSENHLRKSHTQPVGN